MLCSFLPEVDSDPLLPYLRYLTLTTEAAVIPLIWDSGNESTADLGTSASHALCTRSGYFLELRLITVSTPAFEWNFKGLLPTSDVVSGPS
jgi:hypothetical protein